MAQKPNRLAPLLCALVFSACLFGGVAWADAASRCAASSNGSATVAAIEADGVLALSDGCRLRLSGIKLVRQAEAMEWLAKTVMGRAVVTTQQVAALDRHGRQRAHIATDRGVWVQGEMLARGLAILRTTPEDDARAGEMLAIEATARRLKRGGWGKGKEAAIQNAAQVAAPQGAFVIVEGRVVTVARVGKRVFLNFGTDWREDFTAVIETAGRAALRKARLDPLSLKGQRVRLRGWVRWWNGPMVEIDHRAQIEILK